MNVRRQFLLSLLAASLFPQWGGAQELPTDVRQEIGKFLDTTARKEVSVGRISIDSVAVEGNTLQLFANMNCAYIPFREDNVAEIYQGVVYQIQAANPYQQAQHRRTGSPSPA